MAWVSSRVSSAPSSRCAPQALRREHGIVLHYHLPSRWHGQFGRDVHYLPLHTLQRYWHRTAVQLCAVASLHQHIRLLPPAGT